MESVRVSMFRSVTAKEGETVEVDKVLDDIRSGRWRVPVEDVRTAYAAGGKSVADPVKKQLPAVTFSGNFNGSHKAEDLTKHSGIMCLDFDGINGRIDEARKNLLSDPFCFALFISPTGTGIKFLIRVEPDATKHGQVFDTAAEYFKKTHNLAADKSGRDVCRLCFVSYDQGLVHNPDTAVFKITPEQKTEPRPISSKREDDTPERAKVEDALHCISANCAYDEWIEIGMALQSWSPIDGRAIWDSWSRTAPERYDEKAIESHWKTFKEKSGGVTIATLFKKAIDAGWRPVKKIKELTVEKAEVRAPHLEKQSSADALPTATDNDKIIILPGGSVSITNCAETIFQKLAPDHELFIRGGVVMELRQDDAGGLRLDVMRAQAFRSRIEKLGMLVVWRSGSEGQSVLKPTTCPADMAEALLASEPAANFLPKVRGLVACPVLAEIDGQLRVLAKGYHAVKGGLLVTAGKLPPKMEVDQAVEALNLLVADFDFASPGDRSRALASFITPALRLGGWLGGHIPIDIAEADQSQSGKTYRQKLVFAIYREEPYRIALRDGGVGGLDESIAQALIAGRPFIQVDNVRGRIESQFIEMMTTAGGCIGARVPHRGEVQVDSRHFLLMMTSNGIETTRDLANRASIIRIRKRPGFTFREFPAGDLLAHVHANQALFLGAVFTVISAWSKAGKPRTEEKRHDFREWAQVLDWIVQHILREAPLIDGHNAAQDRVSNPALTWLRQVALVIEADHRMDEAIIAGSIGELCEDHNIDIPGLRDTADESGRNKRVGVLMKKAFGEVEEIEIDRYRVKRTEKEHYYVADQQFKKLRAYVFNLQKPEQPELQEQPLQLPKKPPHFSESIEPYSGNSGPPSVEAEERTAIMEEGNLNL